MLQGAVRDDVTVERGVTTASLQDAHDANKQEERPLGEEDNTRASVDASVTETGGQAVGLTLQLTICELEIEFLDSGEGGVCPSIVLKGMVDTLKGCGGPLSESELPEEFPITRRKV